MAKQPQPSAGGAAPFASGPGGPPAPLPTTSAAVASTPTVAIEAKPPPAPTNGLDKIKHVIVLMLENRSFDNLLGWLYENEAPSRGQRFEGVNRSMWCPLDNIDGDGVPFVEKVFVKKNGEVRGKFGKVEIGAPDFTLPSPDPGEGYGSTNHQLFNQYQVATLYPPEPTNQGFVNDYRDAMLFGTYTFGEPPTDPRSIMACYTPEQVPALSTLARQFAVCDHWFCSVPSQTLPNRHFVHCATSNGSVNNKPVGECDARTVFNAIEDAIAAGRKDLTWRVYCGSDRGQLFSLTRLLLPRLAPPSLDKNFQAIDQFYADAKAGRLPTYAFLEPRFHQPGGNDQHPPLDVRPGDKLIADVYDAVADSPQWKETLLVVTYDEHGGCFDHVAPPGRAAHPDPKRPPGQDGFLFNRFGVRVPAIVVSPWIEAGTIGRPLGPTPFDHTSVIATVRRVCGIAEPLTERDKAAPDLGCLLTRTVPRDDRPVVHPLPLPAAPREAAACDEPAHDLHRLVVSILEKATGKACQTGQSYARFVHDAYESVFPRKAKPPAVGATPKAPEPAGA